MTRAIGSTHCASFTTFLLLIHFDGNDVIPTSFSLHKEVLPVDLFFIITFFVYIHIYAYAFAEEATFIDRVIRRTS